jgi:hypothetical protein
LLHPARFVAAHATKPMFQRAPYFFRVIRFNTGVWMARVPTVSQLVQRVVVEAREVMLLNRAALQPFEIVFLDFLDFLAFLAFLSGAASTFAAPGVFRFHILNFIAQLQYEDNLNNSQFKNNIKSKIYKSLGLGLDGLGLMSLVLNLGSSRLISFIWGMGTRLLCADAAGVVLIT